MNQEELMRRYMYSRMMSVTNRGYQAWMQAQRAGAAPSEPVSNIEARLKHFDGTSTDYDKFEDAIAAIAENDTLILAKNIRKDTQVILSNAVDCTLDFNGKTFTSPAGEDVGLLIGSPSAVSGTPKSNVVLKNAVFKVIGEPEDPTKAIDVLLIQPRKPVAVPGSVIPGRRAVTLENVSFYSEYDQEMIVGGTNEGATMTLSSCNIASKVLRMTNGSGPAYNNEAWKRYTTIINSNLCADFYNFNNVGEYTISSGSFSSFSGNEMIFHVGFYYRQEQIDHNLSICGGTFNDNLILSDCFAMNGLMVHTSPSMSAITHVRIYDGTFEGTLSVNYPTTEPVFVNQHIPLVHIEGGKFKHNPTELVSDGKVSIPAGKQFEQIDEYYQLVDKS